MQIGMDYGQERIDFEIEAASLVATDRAPPATPLPDPIAAIRDALENPRDWPALRRALTPDDHVAIVVDEQLPRLAELLVPILQHLVDAHVSPEAITLLCAPSAAGQPWIDNLPDEFADVHVEVHDPHDRRKLSYLATTRQGRRLYINRTAVDADQLVVLTGRRYDPVLGCAGAETALYPTLSDEATRTEFLGQSALDVPGTLPSSLRDEAAEVAWLLGAPFLVQVIEGPGDSFAYVIGGSLESSIPGQRALEAVWRVEVHQPADMVLASISGDPARHNFASLALALSNAARVVQSGGHIVLLTGATPSLAGSAELFRNASGPRQVLDQLQREPSPDLAALQWATATEKAHVLLLSGLSAEAAEELFVTPMDRAAQAQRLLAGEQSCLVLPDAHKMLALLKG
jgi:nickel-dependent lactate racemase